MSYIIRPIQPRDNRRLAVLIRTVLEEFEYTHLYLESFPGLHIAVSLYNALGFQNIDTPLGNSGHFACTLWMTKAIG